MVLAAHLTRTDAVMGTPAYMSPEQHRGEESDARSDQFSFCVALHEALYGVRPFAGEDPAEVLEAIEARRFTVPVRDAPRWLRPLLLRGLEPRSEARWPSMETLLEALSREPAVRRRRWLLAGGAAAVAAAVAAGFVLTGEPQNPCPGAGAQARAVWSAGARGRVRAAFAATGSPIATGVFERVDRLLTARLDGWAAAHSEACQATHVRGEQSEAMLDLRMQCLERARRQIGFLVDVWAREPVNLDKAIEAASSVGDVAACADTEALAMPVAPPRDAALARRIEEVRAQLDAVQAHQRAGRLHEGLALARKAVSAARPLDYAPILAEALAAGGNLEIEVAELDAGISMMYAAAETSATARDDVLHARILCDLLFHLGANGKRIDEGTTVSRFAEAAVARAGNRDELVAALLRGQAQVLGQEGKHEEALARLRRALPLYRARLGADHPLIARVMASMAASLRRLGRLDEAKQLFRQALADQERISGPEHPSVAATLHNLVTALAQTGEYDEAARLAERALAIREKAYPPDHPMVARSVDSLAQRRAQQGRNDEAQALFERAEKIRVKALGPDHPDTLATRDNLAVMAIDRGDVATARRLMESVIASKTRALGPDNPSVAHAWSTLGVAFLAAEDWKQAEAAFVRGIAILRKQPGDPPELSDALVGQGQARVGAGRFADAIPPLEEARAIDERVRGSKSGYRPYILVPLGEAHLGAGRPGQAARLIEKGLALAEQDPNYTLELAIMRFHLARALWATGARPRALELAGKARAGLTEPRQKLDRARVDRWLKARGGATRGAARGRPAR